MLAPASDYLARVYYWIVAPATIALVFLVFPMRGYDERAHVYRAEALSDGVVLPAVVQTLGGQPAAGGQVDRTLRGWTMRFTQWSTALIPTSRRHYWSTTFVHSDGVRIDVPYSNTAIYPPFLYVQSATAILLAKAAGAPVAVWFYAARLANALTAIAIVAALMRTMTTLRPVILVFASLPIVFFQSSTVSIDGVLLPVALAFACLLSQVFSATAKRRATTVALAVATVILCVGKIAFVPFAILPPLAARVADGRWSRRAVLLAATSIVSVILWAGWSWIIHDKVFGLSKRVSIDPFAQLQWVLQHPLAALQVLGRTAAVDAPSIVPDAIGVHVGGLALWTPMIGLGAFVLVVAVFGQTMSLSPPRWFVGLVTALAFSVGIGIVFLLYLQFNAVESEVVRGVQGRYFIPSLMMLIVFSPFALGRRSAAVFDALAIVFAITSVVTTVVSAATGYWVA